MQKAIIHFIDQFYFIFKRVMPVKTYRYAVCGGSNLVLDTVLYFVVYHFVVIVVVVVVDNMEPMRDVASESRKFG